MKISFILIFILLSIFSNGIAKPILRIYTSETFANGVGKFLKQDFEEQHCVKIQYVTCQGATSILFDLLNEKKTADGFIGLSNDLFGSTKIKKVLAPHLLSLEKLKLPIMWSDDKVYPIFYSVLSFVYNKKKLKTKISTFEDFLKTKDKIILIDPRSSNVGFGLLLWVKSIYGPKTYEYWKALKSKILTIPKNWTQAYSLFIQNESPIVLSYITSAAYHRLKENDLNIDFLPMEEGHIMQFFVGGILKRSKHFQLMKEFLFLATSSLTFQKKIVFEDWSFPVIDIKEPLPKEFQQIQNFKMPFMPDYIEENKKKWLEEWLDAMS